MAAGCMISSEGNIIWHLLTENELNSIEGETGYRLKKQMSW